MKMTSTALDGTQQDEVEQARDVHLLLLLDSKGSCATTGWEQLSLAAVPAAKSLI